MSKNQKENLKQKSKYLAISAIISIVIGLIGLASATTQFTITNYGIDYSQTIGTGFSGLSFVVLGGFLLLASVIYDLKALEIAND